MDPLLRQGSTTAAGHVTAHAHRLPTTASAEWAEAMSGAEAPQGQRTGNPAPTAQSIPIVGREHASIASGDEAPVADAGTGAAAEVSGTIAATADAGSGNADIQTPAEADDATSPLILPSQQPMSGVAAKDASSASSRGATGAFQSGKIALPAAGLSPKDDAAPRTALVPQTALPARSDADQAPGPLGRSHTANRQSAAKDAVPSAKTGATGRKTMTARMQQASAAGTPAPQPAAAAMVVPAVQPQHAPLEQPAASPTVTVLAAISAPAGLLTQSIAGSSATAGTGGTMTTPPADNAGASPFPAATSSTGGDHPPQSAPTVMSGSGDAMTATVSAAAPTLSDNAADLSSTAATSPAPATTSGVSSAPTAPASAAARPPTLGAARRGNLAAIEPQPRVVGGGHPVATTQAARPSEAWAESRGSASFGTPSQSPSPAAGMDRPLGLVQSVSTLEPHKRALPTAEQPGPSAEPPAIASAPSPPGTAPPARSAGVSPSVAAADVTSSQAPATGQAGARAGADRDDRSTAQAPTENSFATVVAPLPSAAPTSRPGTTTAPALQPDDATVHAAAPSTSPAPEHIITASAAPLPEHAPGNAAGHPTPANTTDAPPALGNGSPALIPANGAQAETGGASSQQAIATLAVAVDAGTIIAAVSAPFADASTPPASAGTFRPEPQGTGPQGTGPQGTGPQGTGPQSAVPLSIETTGVTASSVAAKTVASGSATAPTKGLADPPRTPAATASPPLPGATSSLTSTPVVSKAALAGTVTPGSASSTGAPAVTGVVVAATLPPAIGATAGALASGAATSAGGGPIMSAATTATPHASVPATPDAMAASIIAMCRSGQSSLVLRLDPPGLGTVSVHLALGGNSNVNVLFVPAIAQTAHLLQSGLGDLRQAMATSGLTLGQVQIGGGASGGAGGGASGGNPQPQPGTTSRVTAAAPAEPALADPTLAETAIRGARAVA